MKKNKSSNRLSDSVFEEVHKVVDVLKSGGIVLYPTDTIWGIGCDAKNERAVEKIYQLKERDPDKSMLILIDRENNLGKYVKDIPKVAWGIIGFAEKPTTVIFDKSYNLAANLTAEDGSIGIRVTSDVFCQKIIQTLKKPIVSTSANLSGGKSPKTFKDIDPKIINGVDYVVKYRQKDMEKVKSSSILRLRNDGRIEVIRK